MSMGLKERYIMLVAESRRSMLAVVLMVFVMGRVVIPA
jgi:hypothetical protein